MDDKVSTASARLDDNAAMAAFLSPIPNGEELAKVLAGRHAVSTRAYDDEAQTARFVESDGNIAMCFTVVDITIDQAEMIETEWESIGMWGDEAFRSAVAKVLGG
jgi:hypothetical protein